jgi:hypothetical protein
MLAGESLELSHVVPTALTDEMVAAIKEVTKQRTALSVPEAVKQGLTDSAVQLPTYDRSKLHTGIVHVGLARGDAMALESHNVGFHDFSSSDSLPAGKDTVRSACSSNLIVLLSPRILSACLHG